MSAGTEHPTDDWDATRRRVLNRDGHACRFCGTTDDEHREEHDTGLHVHHVIPRNDGGTDDPDNLLTVCCRCHRTLEETHAKALSQLERDPDETTARAGATYTVRRCWAEADKIDDGLADFMDQHPTFAREFALYKESDGTVESYRLREMLGELSSEWSFLINWGFREGFLEAAGFLKGWTPDALDEDALDESDLPDPRDGNVDGLGTATPYDPTDQDG